MLKSLANSIPEAIVREGDRMVGFPGGGVSKYDGFSRGFPKWYVLFLPEGTDNLADAGVAAGHGVSRNGILGNQVDLGSSLQ